MPKVELKEGDDFEELIRRFKRSVNKAGTLADLKRHEAFYPKCLRRKMKSEEARRKRAA